MKDKIRSLRIKKGLTQGQLATSLGFRSPSLITMWENGERTPRTDKLPELAKILGCDVSALFESEVRG